MHVHFSFLIFGCLFVSFGTCVYVVTFAGMNALMNQQRCHFIRLTPIHLIRPLECFKSIGMKLGVFKWTIASYWNFIVFLLSAQSFKSNRILINQSIQFNGQCVWKFGSIQLSIEIIQWIKLFGLSKNCQMLYALAKITAECHNFMWANISRSVPNSDLWCAKIRTNTMLYRTGDPTFCIHALV